MQKNLYFRTVIMRRNVVVRAILNFFLSLCSYPRLILEVFIRKNFGERYFSLASVITVAVLLILYPVIGDKVGSLFNGNRYGYGDKQNFMGEYATWYLFVAAFLYFSFLRWREIKRNPSVYDFARYSLSAGEIHPMFYKINFNGKTFSPRLIETFIEPFAFFIVGFLLYLANQGIGGLIIIASICYGLSYAGAYKNGDDFALNKIDEMIMNEETANSFSAEQELNNRGVRFYMKKPNREDLRKRLADSFIEDDQPKSEKTYAE